MATVRADVVMAVGDTGMVVWEVVWQEGCEDAMRACCK